MIKRDAIKLQTDDVCRRFGITRWTLRRWHSDETMAFPKPIVINRRHYYDSGEILRWEMARAGIDPDAITEMRGLPAASGVIVDYGQLVKAMVNERQKMKLSVMEVDALSGLQEGYTTKLENWQRDYGRGLGPETLPLWLGALRLGIVLVKLPKATRKFKDLAAPLGAGG